MNMETKINVAAILKDKPQGTKLYSPIFGKLRYEDLVPDLGEFTVVTSDNTLAKHSFRSDSRYNRHGEPLMLLPSKEMGDWSKFAWKKGDVLVNKDVDVYIIFESFFDDTYCSFAGKYYLWKENNDTEHFYKNERLLTSDFQKAGKYAAQTYISTIEERLGGKLNRKTLEIEKTQPEFKDGDFVYYTSLDGDKCIGIVKETKNDAIMFHVDYNLGTHSMDFNVSILKENFEFYKSNDLDDEIALNEALYSRYKSWNKEKNILEELKPKVDMKPFDKVLVRDSKQDSWRANLFYHKDKDGYYCCVYANWVYCIPYNDQTKHLLGTTDEWKGGEG